MTDRAKAMENLSAILPDRESVHPDTLPVIRDDHVRMVGDLADIAAKRSGKVNMGLTQIATVLRALESRRAVLANRETEVVVSRDELEQLQGILAGHLDPPSVWKATDAQITRWLRGTP